MLIRILSLSTVVLLISCSKQQSGSPLIAEQSDLTVKTPIEKALAKHQADTFHVNLQPNAFVYGYADQINFDAIVEVYSPSNRQVLSVDNPSRGPENFQFTADSSGVYKIVVKPFEEQEGKYAMVLSNVEMLATDPEKRIDQLMAASLGEGMTPGATIAVQKEGKVIYSKGFGYGDLESEVKNNPQTIFHIASVSKQFTSFAIAMLVDQGKISLDDDIRKYLPEMNDFGTPITINHLVHHTSGLRDQWNLLALAGWRLDDVITKNQILRVVSRQKELNFKPGEEYVYCNTGFTLMAEIVSRVSGKTFPEWTKENIFDPLEMKNTLFYDDHEKIVKGRAYSYYRSPDGYKKSVLSYANAGATSLFTTVEDLSKWAANFQNIKVGNDTVMKLMDQRFVLNKGDTIPYAFGQSHGIYKGLKTMSHGGADAGYRTMLLRFPEEKISISVFSNLASFNPGGMAYQIADLYLKDKLVEEKEKKKDTPPSPEKKEEFDKSTVKLNEYTGAFYSPELLTTYTFEVVNDTLVAKHQRHDDIKFNAKAKDSFSGNAWFIGNVDFIRDKSNKVNGFKVNSGRVRNLVFDKQ